MKVIWFEEAWEDYLCWQSEDRKTLKRINLLLQDATRNGYSGRETRATKGRFYRILEPTNRRSEPFRLSVRRWHIDCDLVQGSL